MSYYSRIKRSLRGCRPRLSLGLDLFGGDYNGYYCLDLFGYLIDLPFLDRFAYHPEEIMDKWGFYVMERSIWFWWKDKKAVFYFPWDLEHLKCEVMRPDGTWVKESNKWDKDHVPDGRWEATYPYTYTLKNGEVQHRQATIHVERREWRWRWFMWCPLTALVRKSIDIRFDDEVGERTGSWKGGCIGTGYTMKKGETPEQCLRRMERERVFD